jgi:hypothetical protein
METENKTTQDCGCDGDCCTPKRSKLWMKIVFIVIVAAAIGIVSMKLIEKSDAPVPPKKSCCSDSTKCSNQMKDNAKTNDSTKSKGCDKTKGSSCCSKDKE